MFSGSLGKTRTLAYGRLLLVHTCNLMSLLPTSLTLPALFLYHQQQLIDILNDYILVGNLTKVPLSMKAFKIEDWAELYIPQNLHSYSVYCAFELEIIFIIQQSQVYRSGAFRR